MPATIDRAPAGATQRGDLLGALAVAIGCFAIYAAGACRTIYVGDSGELVTAVHLLGIPHPSGYPLYVLLGKIWTIAVPAGSVAFRMSLFSGAFGGGTVALLFLAGRALGADRLAALCGALLLAFAPSFWGEANVQRVYTLNAFFLAAATLVAIRWHVTGRRSLLFAVFFLSGVGAANHTFMAVYAIAFAAFAAVVAPGRVRRAGDLFGSAAAFAAGLLPYLYLPLRSRFDPRLDWGDPETLDGFLGVVLRRGFWQRAWIESPRDLVPITLDFVRSLGAESAWFGVVLAGVGVAASRRRPILLLPLFVIAANLAVMALHGSQADLFIWHRYYIPSYAMLALLAAVGAAALRKVIEARPGGGRRWQKAVFALVLVVPLAMLATGFTRNDRSRYRIADDFGRHLLASLPPGARLIATDDNVLFGLMYLHLVEGVRPDIDLVMQGVDEPARPSFRFNPDDEPLFFTHHPNWNVPQLDFDPVGVVFRVVRAGSSSADFTPRQLRLAGEDDPRIRKDFLTRNLIGHFHFMLGLSFEKRDWRRARDEFRAAAAASPDSDVLLYNLGLVHWRNGSHDDAIASFRAADLLNPRGIVGRRLPGSSEVQRWYASDRLREVVEEKSRAATMRGGGGGE